MKTPDATIIGAGLCGSLLAIYLARAGYSVDVYEGRPDLRVEDVYDGRSINLALSRRGEAALEAVGLLPAVEAIQVPMYGRRIHHANGSVDDQPYGRTQKEHQKALSRTALNSVLLDALESYPNVNVHFSQRFEAIDFEEKKLTFCHQRTQKREQRHFQHLFGADGAGSKVRELAFPANSFQSHWLLHSYKELAINAEQGKALARNHLHIWPRHDFMLIALPDTDGSFTCTLFMPTALFATLKTENDIQTFFEEHFPVATPLISNLCADFLQHPTSGLATVQGQPWYRGDQVLLLGDAAHAMVPFLGQGMNATFEDCQILAGLLEKHCYDWREAFRQFSLYRKPNTDAISHMALENYREMRHDVESPGFLLRKKVEALLMQRYPDQYFSRYQLIAFHQVPYCIAQRHGILQEQLLDELCQGLTDSKDMVWAQHQPRLERYFAISKALMANQPAEEVFEMA